MLHLSGWNLGSVEDALCRVSVPVWLSVRIMDVMAGPHAKMEAGPGVRTGGCVTMPWAVTRRGERGYRGVGGNAF